MARFIYRLQKVFELRERKKKQQEQRVIEARTAVKTAEQALETHYKKLDDLAIFMKTAAPSFYENYDRYKEQQKIEEAQLQQQVSLSLDHLALQKQRLIKAQADVEALIKHRDKAKEEWLSEENYLEMKQLDEVGSQRYFRQKIAAEADDE